LKMMTQSSFEDHAFVCNDSAKGLLQESLAETFVAPAGSRVVSLLKDCLLANQLRFKTQVTLDCGRGSKKTKKKKTSAVLIHETEASRDEGAGLVGPSGDQHWRMAPLDPED